MTVKESRFVIMHAQLGLYLGNNWWSNQPEAKQVNCAPTFTAKEINQHDIINRPTVGATGAWARLVGWETIDMDGHRVSVRMAVEHGLVPVPWCDHATGQEG